MKVFLDTNVLVYVQDPRDPVKQERARHLLETHRAELSISAQVLIEYAAVCIRRLGLPAEHVRRDIENYCVLPVANTDGKAVVAAAEIADRNGLSIYDGLIVEAAQRMSCDVLFTEDASLLSADLEIDVVNPFA